MLPILLLSAREETLSTRIRTCYSVPMTTIHIDVENGSWGGMPRTWRGRVVASLNVNPTDTVEHFLNQVKAIENLRTLGGVTLETIQLGNFHPTDADLQKSVGECGLAKGTLQVYNGMMD